MENVTLSILMPVFNERRTVERAIDDALTAELPVDGRELILVDDGSTDGTRELLDQRQWPGNVKLVHHDSNAGKGAAVRTALRHATGQVAAILDADLEYEAADLAPVLAPILAGEASVVFGKRSWTKENSYSSWYAFGNKAVTFATNVLFNCRLSDVMTCHKALRTDLFQSLPLREPGFAIEPEIAAWALRAGEQIHEVPISYQARTREEGKKLTVFDGLRVLRTLVRCRFAEPSQLRAGDPSVTAEAQVGADSESGAAGERGGDVPGGVEHDRKGEGLVRVDAE
jgi:glycosyltransferase involved in cell wall biosynthesis